MIATFPEAFSIPRPRTVISGLLTQLWSYWVVMANKAETPYQDSKGYAHKASAPELKKNSVGRRSRKMRIYHHDNI